MGTVKKQLVTHAVPVFLLGLTVVAGTLSMLSKHSLTEISQALHTPVISAKPTTNGLADVKVNPSSTPPPAAGSALDPAGSIANQNLIFQATADQ